MNNDKGYTLVELMAVMVIIGLMTSAIVWTIPKNDTGVTSYAETLVRELNGAAETSLLTGQTTALGVSKDAYSIYAYENEEWIARRTAEWPDGVFVKFSKEEAELKLTDDVIPLAMFEPTGQSTLFALTLTNQDGNIRLISEGDGRVVLEAAQ